MSNTATNAHYDSFNVTALVGTKTALLLISKFWIILEFSTRICTADDISSISSLLGANRFYLLQNFERLSIFLPPRCFLL